ncbi:unnamed protein product [Arabidopsis thaliana]|uniref:Uncharacterized protein n=1 Tax=Arabidopsis thaliana TaxID=3702 RepID=A0A654EWZ6_ARATH|nr:unnamed protein product [Arabidopsis thaliana]
MDIRNPDIRGLRIRMRILKLHIRRIRIRIQILQKTRISGSVTGLMLCTAFCL